MTIPTNTQTTYLTVGRREDLADVIYNISPTDTPFMNGIKRNKAANTLHEWQTDSLASADGTNAAVEGDVATASAVNATTRLTNYCQISTKTATITGTMEEAISAGRKNEMAYQMMKRSKELKRDMETILVGTNQAKVAGNGTTARKTASILSWIKTNTSIGTGAAANPSAADGTGTRTDGTQRALTESLLKTVIASIWDAGGEPTVIMVGSFNKQQIDGFTGGNTRYNDISGNTIVASVDVYKSSLAGTLKIVPNRFMRTRDCLVLDMTKWAMSSYRDFRTKDLASTGDYTSKQILAEYALEASNEAASGGVFDLTTS